MAKLIAPTGPTVRGKAQKQISTSTGRAVYLTAGQPGVEKMVEQSTPQARNPNSVRNVNVPTGGIQAKKQDRGSMQTAERRTRLSSAAPPKKGRKTSGARVKATGSAGSIYG